jgi:hypothetical protein
MEKSMNPEQTLPEQMEQEEIAPAQVSVQPVNINARCALNPDPVRRKKLEGIRWMNHSSGAVDLKLPEIFCPPPSPNPFPLPRGAWVTLYLCDNVSAGRHKYEVEGAHCAPTAARIGTIDVEN